MLPADHVTALITRNALNIDQPLRWRGTLRADPLDLPWGIRYQLDLEAVQSAGAWIGVSGGLRSDYYFPDDSARESPMLRAGDRVEILTRARTVRNFGNPGSFDYRTFLARQDVHLTSTVRSTELIEKIPGPRPSLGHQLARLRGLLLRQSDAMFAAADDRAAVVRAMLLGDRSFLDTEQVQAFQQTGAYHILVLSGLQVGVLAAILLWTTRRLRLPMLAGHRADDCRTVGVCGHRRRPASDCPRGMDGHAVSAGLRLLPSNARPECPGACRACHSGRATF